MNEEQKEKQRRILERNEKQESKEGFERNLLSFSQCSLRRRGGGASPPNPLFLVLLSFLKTYFLPGQPKMRPKNIVFLRESKFLVSLLILAKQQKPNRKAGNKKQNIRREGSGI